MATLWKTRALALAAVLAVALLVGACGGGDDAKPNTSATATQQSGVSTDSATPEPEDTDTSGDDTSGDDTGGLIDACTLLTKAEVDAVVGDTSEGNVTNDPPTSACFWDGLDEFETAKVELIVYTGTSVEGAMNYYDLYTGDSVEGIGDEAKWVDSIGYLYVLKGNNEFELAVYTDVDQMNVTKSLAQKAVDRLP